MSDSKKLRMSRRDALKMGGGVAALFAAPRAAAETAQYKTPGVYITEQNAFPNSVVEAATSVAAFVGYTEKAGRGSVDLRGKPTRITSMAEYVALFGGAPKPVFGLTERAADLTAASLASAEGADGAALRVAFELPDGVAGGPFDLARFDAPYLLHSALQLFFQNGGDACHVTSIGGYDDRIDGAALATALTALEKEPEPSILVIPDAVRLSRPDSAALQQEMLLHCGETMRSRVALLDVHGGYLPLDHPSGDPVRSFRTEIGSTGLSYGVAYYPWLQTTLFSGSDFSFANLSEYTRVLVAETTISEHGGSGPIYEAAIRILPDSGSGAHAARMSPASIDATLRAASPLYKTLLMQMAALANRMPPSAAMAGVYALTDSQAGVWKAPANVGLASVTAPMATISNDQQQDLNVPIDGLAVNAIRSFIGEGVLVWGARTLDGNSQDWRYINVRRTMIMLEQSIMRAAQAYVFAPNDASTWVSVKAMIENFLTNVWKAGGLAGARSADAFSVDVGLGSTMTPQDILEGLMRITVKVAVVRPAEFIVISFAQKMQQG